MPQVRPHDIEAEQDFPGCRSWIDQKVSQLFDCPERVHQEVSQVNARSIHITSGESARFGNQSLEAASAERTNEEQVYDQPLEPKPIDALLRQWLAKRAHVHLECKKLEDVV